MLRSSLFTTRRHIPKILATNGMTTPHISAISPKITFSSPHLPFPQKKSLPWVVQSRRNFFGPGDFLKAILLSDIMGIDGDDVSVKKCKKCQKYYVDNPQYSPGKNGRFNTKDIVAPFIGVGICIVAIGGILFVCNKYY